MYLAFFWVYTEAPRSFMLEHKGVKGVPNAVCRVLGEMLPPVLSCFQPDLVLYDAGVDPHKDDSLGKLALTDQGLLRRELQVCFALHDEVIRANVPGDALTCVMALLPCRAPLKPVPSYSQP